MKGTTAEDWRVASDLKGDDAELNGLIVVCGPPDRPHLVGDFRSTTLPVEEQMANARLAARAPRLAESLLRIESEIGDLPAGPVTRCVYILITDALKGLDLRPRDDPDHD